MGTDGDGQNDPDQSNRVILLGAWLWCHSRGWQALAQTCPGTTQLTGKNLNDLLTGRWACANLSPTENWNEQHLGGVVVDYKKGPNDPVDPTTPVGTYNISNNGNAAATVTYTYGASSYGYAVYANPGTTIPNPGSYSFCTTGGGINIPVTVSASHC